LVITDKLLSLRSETLFIAPYGLLDLLGKLANALFLELKLLALQCLVPFKLNLLLCEVIKSL
jgi:hypothetical protein